MWHIHTVGILPCCARVVQLSIPHALQFRHTPMPPQLGLLREANAAVISLSLFFDGFFFVWCPQKGQNSGDARQFMDARQFIQCLQINKARVCGSARGGKNSAPPALPEDQCRVHFCTLDQLPRTNNPFWGLWKTKTKNVTEK